MHSPERIFIFPFSQTAQVKLSAGPVRISGLTHLLLLLIHGGLLAGEGAARGCALSGELIAIGIMSGEERDVSVSP